MTVTPTGDKTSRWLEMRVPRRKIAVPDGVCLRVKPLVDAR